ncbi:hypothetical protein [Dactylosporangium matsuzakiense]|uniref:Uncharacterized protein n=1 Tax=Dactylosporangium matsuzakiense TaxID=53360 RepID=A0A9W6KK13_9ACTN|nr:hypothetical protein [Dactylosporangium matsuzakiense]GLL02265.1 hypothetical protein GCM10017581_040070 [Dactylosporangium matsuzakiense]
MAEPADPYRNDDSQPTPPGTEPVRYEPSPSYHPPGYGYPTGTPPGPYLSDADGSRRPASGPSSDDRDPFLVRLWRRITRSR